jgi:hypothetical protein
MRQAESGLIGSATRIIVAGMIAAVFLSAGSTAYAVPSFARQTGQDCTACHVGAFGPQLNSYGRNFKLNGFVWGEASNLPPISAMLQASLTHTNSGQPGGAAQDFRDNDNLSINQLSFFYGGRIYGNFGALIQGTFDGVAKNWAWDNWDIRYANTGQLFGHDFVFGFTFNNNPTAQDLWNTTPAWGFPYARTSLAPSPAAATLIDGGLAQQVAGLSAYTMWNDLIYAEFGLYRSLPSSWQTRLGVELGDQIDGFAPYWRLAVQHNWNGQYASIGTFGLQAHLFPGHDESMGTDHFFDFGFDATYQFIGEGRHVFSLYATYINEHSHLDASAALGNSLNTSNHLNTFRANASYYYDHTYGLTLGWFNTWGSSDAGLFAPDPIGGSNSGSPNSAGYIAQLDLTPFGRADSLWAPWLNLRIALQYTGYVRFNGGVSNYDGSGRNASDNNTFMLMAWFAW